MSNRSLEGTTVLVIGGTGGLGEASCLALAEDGADILFTYHRRQEPAERLAEAIAERGRKAEFRQLDVEDEADVVAAFAAAEAFDTPLKAVVFASCPVIPQTYLSQVTPAQMRAVIATNLFGYFNVVAAAIPALRRAGGGSIVCLTSSAVQRFPRRDGLSSVPKTALEALTRAVAKEEGRYGIRANCVAPHLIEAGAGLRVLDQVDDDIVALMLREIPLGRFGQASDVADAVAFLASPRAGYISGQTIVTDGAWHV